MTSIKTYLLLFFFGISISLSAQTQSKLFIGTSLATLDDIGKQSELTSIGGAYKLNAGYKITEKLKLGLEHMGSYHNVGTIQFTDQDGNPIGSSDPWYRASTYLIKAYYNLINIKENIHIVGGLGFGLSQFVSPELPLVIFGNPVVKESSYNYAANAEIGFNAYGIMIVVFTNIGTKSNIDSLNIHGDNYNYLGASFGYIWNF